MTPKPFFSIIIPTLNEEKLLPNLLNNFTQQTFADFEVIIVDANSTDKTLTQAKKFQSQLNLTIYTTNKQNVSYQRNLGAKKSRADWLIFFDADTQIPHFFLEGIKYHSHRKQPDILTCWSQADTKNKSDQLIATIMNLGQEAARLISQPAGFGAMIAVKKTVFIKIGGFKENITWGEDGDFILRTVKAGYRFTIFPDPKFTFSFRRFRKEGTLNLIRKYAKTQTQAIRLGRPTKPLKDYPMLGGSYYLTPKSKPSLTLLSKLNQDLNQLIKTQKKKAQQLLSQLFEE